MTIRFQMSDDVATALAQASTDPQASIKEMMADEMRQIAEQAFMYGSHEVGDWKQRDATSEAIKRSVRKIRKEGATCPSRDR